MKVILLIFLFAACVASSYGDSQSVIPNTRAQGCVDGICGLHCAMGDVKIFPGDNLNQKGECRHLRCSSDFSIHITNCPVDRKYLDLKIILRTNNNF